VDAGTIHYMGLIIAYFSKNQVRSYGSKEAIQV